jgi:hypothetical protein
MDFPSLYVTTTEATLRSLSLSHELAHLGAGLLLYFGVLGFMGSRRALVLPLAVVMLVEGLNEAVQAAHYGSWRVNDTFADIVWTVLLPLMLFAHAAFGRWRASAMSPGMGPDDRTAIFPV